MRSPSACAAPRAPAVVSNSCLAEPRFSVPRSSLQHRVARGRDEDHEHHGAGQDGGLAPHRPEDRRRQRLRVTLCTSRLARSSRSSDAQPGEPRRTTVPAAEAVAHQRRLGARGRRSPAAGACGASDTEARTAGTSRAARRCRGTAPQALGAGRAWAPRRCGSGGCARRTGPPAVARPGSVSDVALQSHRPAQRVRPRTARPSAPVVDVAAQPARERRAGASATSPATATADAAPIEGPRRRASDDVGGQVVRQARAVEERQQRPRLACGRRAAAPPA